MSVVHRGGDSVSRCPANSKLFCRSRRRSACIDEFLRCRNRFRVEWRSTRRSASFPRRGDAEAEAHADRVGRSAQSGDHRLIPFVAASSPFLSHARPRFIRDGSFHENDWLEMAQCRRAHNRLGFASHRRSVTSADSTATPTAPGRIAQAPRRLRTLPAAATSPGNGVLRTGSFPLPAEAAWSHTPRSKLRARVCAL